MVRKILIAILLFLLFRGNAQKQVLSMEGILKANLSYAQGFMFHYPCQNVYLNGYLEYYAFKNISLRGDAFWYVDSRQEQNRFKQNYLIQFGAMIHKQIGINDFYLGFQPGFSYSQPYNMEQNQASYSYRLMPSLNLSVGYNLFFSKYCNFNVGVNYLINRYRGATNGSLNLDEIMIIGGLGFHLKAKK